MLSRKSGEAARPDAVAAYFVNDLRFFCLHRLPLATELKHRGLSVQVIAPFTEKDKSARNRLSKLGLTVRDVPLSKSGAHPAEELATLHAVRQTMNRTEPVLLHNVGFKAVFHGSHAARLSDANPGVVNHVNGLGHMYAVDGPREIISRQLMNLAFASSFRIVGRQRIIVQNPDDRELLCRSALAPRDRISVVLGSGVNTDEFRPAASAAQENNSKSDSGPVVLFAARLIWTKGVGEFVEVARSLRDKLGDTRWVLVGEPDAGNVGCVPASKIQEWAREPGIEWWGWQEDMTSVYRRADIVCLPTVYREGIPKVLIEAAACELPLVATDVPGCREIVRNGENGFLVSPHDEEALSRALRQLLEDDDLRRAMGRRGREIVEENFSEQSVVEQTMDIYEELLPEW